MTQPPRSPFHDGERALKGWIGARDRIEKIGRRQIGDHLPEEHRRFYAGLPWLLVGSLDRDGPEVRSFRGAERLLRFSVDEGVFVKRGMPLGWRFAGWSPSLAGMERSGDAGQP